MNAQEPGGTVIFRHRADGLSHPRPLQKLGKGYHQQDRDTDDLHLQGGDGKTFPSPDMHGDGMGGEAHGSRSEEPEGRALENNGHGDA